MMNYKINEKINRTVNNTGDVIEYTLYISTKKANAENGRENERRCTI